MALGFGYEFDSNRTAHLKNGDLIINDLKLRAVDFFLDLPLDHRKKNALTIYAAYYDYDYGPNLVRNIGVNNIAAVSDPDLLSFNGPGNTYPLLGTGTSLYLEAGYLTQHLRFGRLQPYLSIQRSRFDRLDEPMLAWNLGAHWLLNGHQSKFTVNLKSRPVYFEEDNSIKVRQRKLEFVIQYQITI